MLYAVHRQSAVFLTGGAIMLPQNTGSMVAETWALELAISALLRLCQDYVDVTPHRYEKMLRMSELPSSVLKCLLCK